VIDRQKSSSYWKKELYNLYCHCSVKGSLHLWAINKRTTTLFFFGKQATQISLNSFTIPLEAIPLVEMLEAQHLHNNYKIMLMCKLFSIILP
jgi:hypothetical protein